MLTSLVTKLVVSQIMLLRTELFVDYVLCLTPFVMGIAHRCTLGVGLIQIPCKRNFGLTEGLINDAVLRTPKSGVKNIFEAGQRVVNPALMGPTKNLFNASGKPVWNNIADLMNRTPGFRPNGTTVEEAKAVYKALGNPYLRAAKQWIYENPVKGNAILGGGTALTPKTILIRF